MRTLFFIATTLMLAGCGLQPAEEVKKSSRVTTHTITRADPEKQRQFIEALKSAGISHELITGDDGKQYVKWRGEDNAAVKKVEVALFGEPIPEERSIHFDGTMNDEFKSWLAANSIAFETRMSDGREYVIWSADDYSKIKTWKHFPKSYVEQLQSSNITVNPDARALP
jgi:hypothetical protein